MLDLQKALNKPTNPNSRPNRQVINVKEHLTAIASIIPTKPDVAVTLLDDVIGSLIEIRRTVRSYVPGEAPEPVREEAEVKPKAEKPKAKKAAEPVVEPAPVAEPAPVVEPVVEAAPEPALPPALDLSAEGK